MGDGPFRDSSAAIERAEILERENAELLAEIDRLRGGSSEAEKARAHDDTVRRLTRERDALKIELDKMRYSAPAVIDNATRKLREERDELRTELGNLRSELSKKLEREEKLDELHEKLEGTQDALLQAEREIKRLSRQCDDLAVKNALLKEQMPPSDDNRGAVFKRVTEERDELLAKVRELEEREASRSRKKR